MSANGARPGVSTFEDAWKSMEAKGYRYGGGALDNVRLGYQLALAVAGTNAVLYPACLRALEDVMTLVVDRRGFSTPAQQRAIRNADEVLRERVTSMSEDQANSSDVLLCARVAHEANRAYCATLNDFSQVGWDHAEPWQRESAIAGVARVVGTDGVEPEDLHRSWCDKKTADGWTYGNLKDPVARTHPCLVPYRELPAEQRMKDALFLAVVQAVHRTLVRHRQCLAGTIDMSLDDVGGEG